MKSEESLRKSWETERKKWEISHQTSLTNKSQTVKALEAKIAKLTLALAEAKKAYDKEEKMSFEDFNSFRQKALQAHKKAKESSSEA